MKKTKAQRNAKNWAKKYRKQLTKVTVGLLAHEGNAYHLVDDADQIVWGIYRKMREHRTRWETPEEETCTKNEENEAAQ